MNVRCFLSWLWSRQKWQTWLFVAQYPIRARVVAGARRDDRAPP
eukprot:SAG31_NODE_19516_length_599_cov_1.730000_2_plen_43_part_01